MRTVRSHRKQPEQSKEMWSVIVLKAFLGVAAGAGIGFLVSLASRSLTSGQGG